ncbi:chymotrypsin-like elastase family member 2A [Centroberyx affinis]|uniref:chymotrypsin-like elastase family member 2A n=1 Tax=Centroberyx affinis TaxID=166261 RepID=UPI003A5C42BC
MTSIILVLALITSTYGCGTPPIEPDVPRVVNGVNARPHSWPWQISLQIERNGYSTHTCGGSLIATNWVLTAAHCINMRLRYRVFVGKHNLRVSEPNTKAIRPAKIIVHERWTNSVSEGNDIAMIKLSEHVSLTDQVQLACVPAPNTILPRNYPCYITGWGAFYIGGPSYPILQQALLPVVDHDTCSQNNWWGNGIHRSMVCAGGDGVVAGCSGDSGGPLNCKNRRTGVWEVHGITSFVFKYGCNYRNKPTVFTRVSDFNEWIRETMMNN